MPKNLLVEFHLVFRHNLEVDVYKSIAVRRSVKFTTVAAEIRSASVSVQYNARTMEKTYSEAAQACSTRRCLDLLSRDDTCLREYAAGNWRVLG